MTTESLQASDRYEDHGNLDLTRVERKLLAAQGFEPWGKHGWICRLSGGTDGNCYDDRWAMRTALSLEAVA